MFLKKQMALVTSRRRARIGYVSWGEDQKDYLNFVNHFYPKYEIEHFDLSDQSVYRRLKNSYALKRFDVVIDAFSKDSVVSKEVVRDFYDSHISRAILFSDELVEKDIVLKIQYKTFVNWNLPSETRKKLLNLSENALNRLVRENFYFRNDLMKGMIAFDKKLSQKIFARFSHQTILDLLRFDVEKILEIHFSSDYSDKENYIAKSCWQHVEALDLLKAFNSFAWQDAEAKDLDMAAMVLNVFQSILLKDESVIRMNKQIEMVQVGIQLGQDAFDIMLAHYPWLYFYFRELVSLHKNSGMIEVEQMEDLLKSHSPQAHIYRDVIELSNKLLLTGSFDFSLLWSFVFERGYADEVIEALLIHLLKRNLITESEKKWLLFHKKNGFKSLWQKTA